MRAKCLGNRRIEISVGIKGQIKFFIILLFSLFVVFFYKTKTSISSSELVSPFNFRGLESK